MASVRQYRSLTTVDLECPKVQWFLEIAIVQEVGMCVCVRVFFRRGDIIEYLHN